MRACVHARARVCVHCVYFAHSHVLTRVDVYIVYQLFVKLKTASITVCISMYIMCIMFVQRFEPLGMLERFPVLLLFWLLLLLSSSSSSSLLKAFLGKPLRDGLQQHNYTGFFERTDSILN